MNAKTTTDKNAESTLSWAVPHLIAGRGKAADAIAVLMILIGAVTDTLAFRNTLELLLPYETSGTRILLMAVGATVMGLVAAGFLGIAYSIYRRDRPESSRLLVTFAAAAWFVLATAV